MKNYESFIEKYKPVINPIARAKHGSEIADDDVASFNGTMLETYGEELAHVEKIKRESPLRVWTIIDGECNDTVILAGMRFVNRLGYIITEVPAENEDVEVIVD